MGTATIGERADSCPLLAGALACRGGPGDGGAVFGIGAAVTRRAPPGGEGRAGNGAGRARDTVVTRRESESRILPAMPPAQ